MSFKPHIAVCVKCKKESFIVGKRGYCCYCNKVVKQDLKENRHKPISAKLESKEKRKIFSTIKKKFPKPTGEREFFLSEWDKRERKSELSNEPIHTFNIYNWHHILHKKQWKKFRLYAPNLILVTASEHNAIHNGTVSEKYKAVLKEKAEQLKLQYYEKNDEVQKK